MAEMLGFATKNDSKVGDDELDMEDDTKDSDLMDSRDEKKSSEGDRAPTEEFYDSDEVDAHSEYVKGTEYVDESSRIHRNSIDVGTESIEGSRSIWDSAVASHTKRDECRPSASKWDAMFAEEEAEAKRKAEEEALRRFSNSFIMEWSLCLKVPIEEAKLQFEGMLQLGQQRTVS